MWFKWLLIAFFSGALIYAPFEFGKPPKPKSASDAALEIAILLAIVAGLLYYWR